MAHLRQIMLEELERRYAPSTIRAYIRTVEHFARHFHCPMVLGRVFRGKFVAGLIRAAIIHKLLTGKAPVNDRFDLTTGFAHNPQNRKAFDLHRDESKTFLEALNHQTTPCRCFP